MTAKRYIVQLDAGERELLAGLISTGRASACQGDPQGAHPSRTMVMRTREKFVTEALLAVPARKKRSVAFRFTAFVRPNLDVAGAAPTLAAFPKECEAMDAFKSVAIG